MRSGKVWLMIPAAAFAAWIGWLVYLAATTTRPVVLSRPQFLAADLYVLADLHPTAAKAGAPAEEATVRHVVWPADKGQVGERIVVKNLPECDRSQGWAGPGEYILALSRLRENNGVYQVTPLPRSPGFYP